jgi:hypothetical protein
LITQVLPESAAARGRLQTGDVELKDLDGLKAAITANEKVASVPVMVWRETTDKPFVRDVAPGRLGAVLDKDPAPSPLPIAARPIAERRPLGTRSEVPRASRIGH